MELLKTYKSDGAAITFDELIYKIGSYHYNWHYELELIWLLEGKIEVNVNGEVCTLEEGDLYLINSNCGHATFAVIPESVAMRIHISPDFFLSQGIDLSKGKFHLNSSAEKKNPIYDELRYDLAQMQIFALEGVSQFKMNALFYRITEKILDFFVLSQKESREFSLGQKRAFLDSAIEYIENNFRNELTLEQLAAQCNYSTSYLSKMFKTELGINFYEYLTRCRLQQALRSLAITDKKIGEISYETGFNDIKAFNKMFKKHFGTTPSDYRKQISPDLLITDQNFKNQLDETTFNSILEKIHVFVEQEKNQVYDQNPCEICNYKTYEKQYINLVSNLKHIVLDA